MLSVIVPTREDAEALCEAIDAHLGMPIVEQDHLGRDVVTEHWTAPVPLEDGTFAVQVTQDLVQALGLEGAGGRDLAALRKRDPLPE